MIFRYIDGKMKTDVGILAYDRRLDTALVFGITVVREQRSKESLSHFKLIAQSREEDGICIFVVVVIFSSCRYEKV